MNGLHGKLWMSKVLLEIIHTFLVFVGNYVVLGTVIKSFKS